MEILRVVSRDLREGGFLPFEANHQKRRLEHRFSYAQPPSIAIGFAVLVEVCGGRRAGRSH